VHRRAEAGLVTGDLLTGEGIRQAAIGADAVLHLATGRKDVALARTLIDAAREVGIAHLVLISIGSTRSCSATAAASWKSSGSSPTRSCRTPFCGPRSSTNLLEMLFRAQRFSPAVFAPSITMQPIAVEDNADRLVERIAADSAGRVPDIGGPQQRTSAGAGQGVEAGPTISSADRAGEGTRQELLVWARVLGVEGLPPRAV
jgi:hypothetical protein